MQDAVRVRTMIGARLIEAVWRGDAWAGGRLLADGTNARTPMDERAPMLGGS